MTNDKYPLKPSLTPEIVRHFLGRTLRIQMLHNLINVTSSILLGIVDINFLLKQGISKKAWRNGNQERSSRFKAYSQLHEKFEGTPKQISIYVQVVCA